MPKIYNRIVGVLLISSLMIDPMMIQGPRRKGACGGGRTPMQIPAFTAQALAESLLFDQPRSPEPASGVRRQASAAFSPGAQHPQRAPLFPVLLRRMGFGKLGELANDPDFQRVAAEIAGGMRAALPVFQAWGMGLPHKRLTEAMALNFSKFSRQKAAAFKPLARESQMKALTLLAPFVEGQLPDHKVEMKEGPGPLHLQVSANQGTPWQRNLVFEVIDSQDEEKSGAHYFPFLKTGHIPAYVIQIQRRDMKDIDRLLRIVHHEVLETAWRALGCSEKEADEYARDDYHPDPTTHRGIDPVPGQPGMEHAVKLLKKGA